MENREIDCLIAEKVMGYRIIPSSIHKETGFENQGYFVIEEQTEEWNGQLISQPEFSPSTDIQDAWKVVEKLQDKWNVNVGTANPHSKQMGVAREVDKYYCEMYGERNVLEYAETAPMAICNAALKSVGIDIK
jgi:hypothetical protein